jgi:hypothetical protein
MWESCLEKEMEKKMAKWWEILWSECGWGEAMVMKREFG